MPVGVSSQTPISINRVPSFILQWSNLIYCISLKMLVIYSYSVASFSTACNVSNQEDEKLICIHSGSSSTVQNIRSIVSRSLKAATVSTNNRVLFRVLFENVTIPSTGIQCRSQQSSFLCKVSISSATIHVYSRPLISPMQSTWGRHLSANYYDHDLEVTVLTTVKESSGSRSLVVHPFVNAQLRGKWLSKCFSNATLLEGKQCAATILEWKLRKSMPASCDIVIVPNLELALLPIG